jgi:hypothetical protein
MKRALSGALFLSFTVLEFLDLNVCSWPFAAIRNIKNGINPMAASERKADVQKAQIQSVRKSAVGQKRN